MKSEKNFTTLILLAFFLGAFGAHRFYTGKTASAVVQLIMTFTLVLSIVSMIWAFIDLIVILTGSFKDASGAVVK